MKSMLGIVALTGLGAGVVGAVGGSLIGGALASEAGQQPAVVYPQADAGEPLEQVLARLDELGERLSVLESRPATSSISRAPVEALSADEEALQEDLRELVGALKTEDGSLPTDFHATVTRALSDIREAEERERDEARQARDLERMEERISELTTDLGLGTGQANQLRTVLIDTETRRDQMRDQMRESGMGWNDARGMFEGLRNETNTRLQEIFTPDQYMQYQESNNDRFRGWGGGGGGGGRGNDSGGDGGGGGGGGRRRGGI